MIISEVSWRSSSGMWFPVHEASDWRWSEGTDMKVGCGIGGEGGLDGGHLRRSCCYCCCDGVD